MYWEWFFFDAGENSGRAQGAGEICFSAPPLVRYRAKRSGLDIYPPAHVETRAVQQKKAEPT